MGFLFTVVVGLVIWIVVWALGHSGLDSAFIAIAITLIGAAFKILAGYLPGRHG